MSDDLIALGMQADEVRARLRSDKVVTYCNEQHAQAECCVTPQWRLGMTGVEYLESVARTRLETESVYVTVDWRKTGLKVAQIALRFGADDFGYAGDREEDVRRIILDAGFIPKRRDPDFRLFYVR